MFLSVSWCAIHDSDKQSQGRTSRSWDSAAGDMAVLQIAVLFSFDYPKVSKTIVSWIIQIAVSGYVHSVLEAAVKYSFLESLKMMIHIWAATCDF